MKKNVMTMFAALFTINMMADNVKFKIKNMNCENCAKRIEKVLTENGAVTKVKVNLECKAVCISYDATKTNVEALQKALTDAKFQAEIAKQCNKEGGCKHEGKEGEHKCGKKDGQQEEKHECGGEGCGK